jgi:hypothetical protein
MSQPAVMWQSRVARQRDPSSVSAHGTRTSMSGSKEAAATARGSVSDFSLSSPSAARLSSSRVAIETFSMMRRTTASVPTRPPSMTTQKI